MQTQIRVVYTHDSVCDATPFHEVPVCIFLLEFI